MITRPSRVLSKLLSLIYKLYAIYSLQIFKSFSVSFELEIRWVKIINKCGFKQFPSAAPKSMRFLTLRSSAIC